jgi:hypothetical protein
MQVWVVCVIGQGALRSLHPCFDGVVDYVEAMKLLD